MTYILNL